MNQLFGIQTSTRDISSDNISFDGSEPVPAPSGADCASGQVRIFVQPHTQFQTFFSPRYNIYAYIWGIPVHPEISQSEILQWSVNAIVEKRYERFRELIGTFVIVIDEPEKERISFVTDILGIRPMFHGNYNGRIVFGSSVWPLYKAGFSSGDIDYDSVSSWIAYKFNCTDGSLFTDLHRLPPGSVFSHQNGTYTTTPYAEFKADPETPDIRQVTEDIHEIVSSTIKILLHNHPRVCLALSGGYDSRYLLALSLESGIKTIDCASVSISEAEEHIASQVANKLNVPLNMIPVYGSQCDLYDQYFHFMADGFPISKFVTHRIAGDYPGIPMLNGFMGDTIIRGMPDIYKDKYETEWEGDLVDIVQQLRIFFDFRILKKTIAGRIKTRSRIPLEIAVQKGSEIGKVFSWQSLYFTQRFYTSNNFLQHIGQTEALLPYYSWLLLSYKMKYSYKMFTFETYRNIFERYFPELANIPHAADVHQGKKINRNVSACSKKWARQMLPVLCSNKCLSILLKRLCIPLDIAGMAGLRRSENAVREIYRLYLLEKRLKDAGLNFEWDNI